MATKMKHPARVFQTMMQELAAGKIMEGYSVQAPPWLSIVNDIPPSEVGVRTRPFKHLKSSILPGKRKPKNLYRPQPINHLEDELRTTFFKHHPWELARPTVILETDGMDYRRMDWSKPLNDKHATVPLFGESVVQRQMWLMKNEKMSKAKAYDTARREFYAERHREDVQRRIAVEEARWSGAYFGKSPLEIGMMLEDQVFEDWKEFAGKSIQMRADRTAAEVDTFGIEEEEEEEYSAALSNEEADAAMLKEIKEGHDTKGKEDEPKGRET